MPPGTRTGARLRGDAVLAGLLGALVLWTVVPRGGASPVRTVLLLLLAGATYAAGRALSRTIALRTAVAGLVALGAAGATLLLGGTSGEPLAPPLGYGNANGALVVLGTGAALVVALTLPERPARLGGVAASALLLPLAVATGSRAGAGLTALLLVVGLLLAVRPTWGRPLPAVGALLVLLSLAVTVGLASRGTGDTQVDVALSDRRVVLWQEALDLAGRDLLTGGGAGSFAREAPTAIADVDARWTHSVWLQQAAETGLPGLLLLLGVAAVALLRADTDGWEDGGVPALGAAVVTAVLVHASIDYVLHFPVVVATTALLAGLTLAPRRID